MKKLLLGVSAMTLIMSGMVFAQAETSVIDQRQANQDRRIDQGIANGPGSARHRIVPRIILLARNTTAKASRIGN